MIEPEKAREAITDTIASIDAGKLYATPSERAYLAGAVAALDGLQASDEPIGQTSAQ
jgi:hypothetical protein